MVIIIIVMCVCVLMMIVIMPIDNDTMGLLTGAGSSNSFPCPFITWVEQTYSTLVLGSTVMIIIKLIQPTHQVKLAGKDEAEENGDGELGKGKCFDGTENQQNVFFLARNCVFYLGMAKEYDIE